MKKSKKTAQRAKNALDRVSKKAKRKPKSVRQQRLDTSIAPVSAFELGPNFSGVLPAGPSTVSDSDGPKRGRRTVANNFLLGFREDWLYYLEEAWPEIGWHLREIRKAGNCAIEDIQRIFEPVQSKDHCDHGKAFLRGLPQPVDGKTLRANRIRLPRLYDNIQSMRSQRMVLTSSCAAADQSLKDSAEQDKAIIQAELDSVRARLLQLEEKLSISEAESKELDSKVKGQETYWYCSQLRDFLCGEKRYAVEPLRLANALAGLPEMGWRESLDRCSKMQRCSSVRLPYRAFEVIERLWHRRPRDPHRPPTEFFSDQILKMPKKDDGIRDTLCRTWRDLQLALERCWTEQHNEDFMPYAVTAAYIQNRFRDKTPADHILDKHARLLKEPE